jgi:hypothetical protein
MFPSGIQPRGKTGQEPVSRTAPETQTGSYPVTPQVSDDTLAATQSYAIILTTCMPDDAIAITSKGGNELGTVVICRTDSQGPVRSFTPRGAKTIGTCRPIPRLEGATPRKKRRNVVRSFGRSTQSEMTAAARTHCTGR